MAAPKVGDRVRYDSIFDEHIEGVVVGILPDMPIIDSDETVTLYEVEFDTGGGVRAREEWLTVLP